MVKDPGIIASDELKLAVEEGVLLRHSDLKRVRGCSVDLVVGTIFWDGKIIPWDRVSPPQQITVPPGGIVGILTAEELELPADVCATAFAINALSSKGFLVLNPGHVDPGFSGPLSVKALNVRKVAIAIHQGEPIFTVILHRLNGVTTEYQHNVSRDERERTFNATTVETSPRTLAEIIEADPNGPFVGRAEVLEMIRGHWMSRSSFWLAGAAALFALLAVVASLAPLWGSRGGSDIAKNLKSAPTEAPAVQRASRDQE